MTKQTTLRVYGLVQGVGFRYRSSLEAQKLGLVGYVTNLEDNSVKIVIQGPEEVLKDFTNWCYNGVEGSQVSKIEIYDQEPIGEFFNFVIR